jgi:diketogulonate reductase-like aldo/keto reductase
MRAVTLPNGETMPALGLGTWGMGEAGARSRDEVAALRLGLDLGMRLIDTAEMYGEGGAETLVGEAIAGRRDQVFLVSKVYPHNASRRGVREACERSLRRLRCDHLDLYLLHWRGALPLAETIAGFTALQNEGKIRHWGVSNFDLADMAELVALEGGGRVATNQVLYNLLRRGIEWDLHGWCRERQVPIMAYSPLEQGRLLKRKPLLAVAQRHNAQPAQIALAWLLAQDGVCVIPKAADAAHVSTNRAALDIELTAADLAELDRAFPAPSERQPLAML